MTETSGIQTRLATMQAIFPNIQEDQIQKLSRYIDLLKSWNHRMNLVSRKDADRLWEHHLLPSIITLKLIDFERGSWILDIGSGGGLPAIPLKIMRPDLEIVMVDSVRKKQLFLQKMITDLNLDRCVAINQRMEALRDKTEYLNKFDIITARAVSGIDELINWGKPFINQSGLFLFWKGKSDIPELESAAKSLDFHYNIYAIPENMTHHSPKFNELCFFAIRLNE